MTVYPGTYMDSRQRAAARRRQRARVVMTLSGAAVVAVVSIAALLIIGRSPTSSGPSGPPTVPTAVKNKPHSPKPRPKPKQPPVGAIGRYQVATRSINFVDRSIPSLGPRYLPTLVYYPIVPQSQVAAGRYSRGPFPLVVFAPGYQQCRSFYAPLLNSWASAGYVVAAVQFPETNCHVQPPHEADMVNEPADVATVITRMLAISQEKGKALSGMIDPNQVAVAGHSDGADVAAAMAANTCCRDYQLKAALILSGGEYGFGGQYFTGSAPPMLFVQGTSDTWNPPSASLQLYQGDAAGVRYYLNLPGATHFSPYEGTAEPEPVVARVTVAFLNAYVDGQLSRVGQITALGNTSVSAIYSAGQLPG